MRTVTKMPARKAFDISRRSLLRASVVASALASSTMGFAAGSPGFTHSVASGDPDQTSVTLWTRYVGAQNMASWLEVELALDEEFDEIVTRQAGLAGPDTDFCANIRAQGLEPGRWYYYRFTSQSGARSPVGRTRTLPAGPLDAFRIAVFSCANATSGWFNAYAHAAARDDLDLLVHLGDYIYESDLDRSDALPGIADIRGIAPTHETRSLADYRRRYASYRNDPDLQALHSRYPMILLWDDHETVNNSWKDGARNHDETTEGAWRDRMAAGVRAFHEWLPMRPQPYTRYDIGDLASIFRLETRLIARFEQLDVRDWIGAYDGEMAAAAVAFRDGPLADPARTMLGDAQERWLARGLAGSVAQGQAWQLLAQPVIMARTGPPDDVRPWFPEGAPPSPQVMAGLAATRTLSALGVPTSLDKWDGYPAARKRLYDASLAANAELVVMSGDSHNAWAFELVEDERRVGVEFAVQGVSSLGIDKRFGGAPTAIARSLIDSNPELVWCDTSQRGYMVMDITPERIETEYLFIAAREARSTTVQGGHRIVCAHGTRRLTERAMA